MRHGRVVTGTHKTRAFRLAIAALLSVDAVFYVVMAISGAVNFKRLNRSTFSTSQASFFSGVRSVAAMQAIVGFIAFIVLAYPISWSWQSSKRSSDVQRTSGSPFGRLSALAGMLFACASAASIAVETLRKPQSLCVKTVNSQSCLWLMQQPLIRSATACGLLASGLLIVIAIICTLKPRAVRQQPARYLQGLPAAFPDMLQYRSGSLKSQKSTLSEHSTSGRSPSHYQARVYHYHKHQASSTVTFNTFNPYDEKVRSASNTPDSLVAMDYVLYGNGRTSTPDLEEDRESSSPSPPSSPSSYTCQTPTIPVMRQPSCESISPEAKGQRIKRKAVEYTERKVDRRHSEDLVRATHNEIAIATFARLFHNNASLDSMTEFYDAASSIHEPIEVQQRLNKRAAPPRPPRARRSSLPRKVGLGEVGQIEV